jgi:uncharacterized protein YbcI
MAGEEKRVDEDAERLMQPDWLKDVESGQGDRPHSVRAEISNAMVGLMKDFYGKGPTKAKTFLNDNYVFCVMEGGLTRNEETLIERGHEDLVRTYRLRFQEAMEEPTVEAIQRITGRSVIGYHSQIVFNPERAFEILCWTAPSSRAEHYPCRRQSSRPDPRADHSPARGDRPSEGRCGDPSRVTAFITHVTRSATDGKDLTGTARTHRFRVDGR